MTETVICKPAKPFSNKAKHNLAVAAWSEGARGLGFPAGPGENWMADDKACF